MGQKRIDELVDLIGLNYDTLCEATTHDPMANDEVELAISVLYIMKQNIQILLGELDPEQEQDEY